jgi:hypothetical protein
MGKALVVFSYEGVDKDTKGKLIALAGQVKRYGETFRKCGLEIGEAIHEAHDLLAGDGRDGTFTTWVESETDIGISTAYNLLNVFRRAKKFPILETYPPTVAYMLAPESVPDSALREMEKAVKKGARPTIELAKETIAKFREATTRASGKSGQTSKTTATQTEAAKPSGPCPHGGEHDYDDEACKRCHDPKPGVSVEPEPEEATATGKLFTKIFEHLGKVTRLLDDLKKAVPNSKYFDDVFASLECANQDLHKWRRAKK